MRERIATTGFAIRLILRTAPFSAFIMLFIHVLQGIYPGAMAFLYNALTDRIISHAHLSIIYRLTPFFVIALISLAYDANRFVLGLGEVRAHRKLRRAVSELVLEKTRQLTPMDFLSDHVNKRIELVKEFADGPFYWLDGIKLIVESVFVVLSLVAFMATMGWAVEGVFLLSMVAYAAVMHWQSVVEHRMTVHQANRQMQADYLARVLTERGYAKEVRVFSFGRHMIEQWRALNGSLNRQYLRLRAWQNGQTGGMNALAGAVMGGIFVSVALAVSQGTATPGSLAGLSAFIITLGTVIRSVGWQTRYSGQSMARLGFLREFLALRSGRAEAASRETADSEGVELLRTGDVELRAISFTFPGQPRPALQGINLSLRQGETVALVGRNGAGKSTLASILAGEFEPTQGSVWVGDVDRATLSMDRLREGVAVVRQQFTRYECTLRDNIVLGAGVPEAVLQRVLADLGLDALVAKLKDGMDTILGTSFGETDLSGGWWQRVAMARALVRQPALLILDEPTAALDPLAEAEILQEFTRMVKGRTSVIISHRLGSIRHVDRILVLDQGEIVESGTHDELVRRDGIYAGLYATQAQWYQERGA